MSAASPAAHEPSPRPRLTGLLLGQFTGAFNDNAWKMIVALLAMRAVPGFAAMTTHEREAAYQGQTTRAFVAFTVPLCLCSLPAGALADRVSKRTMLVVLKLVEVLLMASAALALVVEPAGGTPALV